MSFVADIGRNAESTSIVAAVIGLARELGMKTTAEGVETEDQYRWLLEHGCTEGQGFLFSRPRKKDDLPALLERGIDGPRRRAAAPARARRRAVS